MIFTIGYGSSKKPRLPALKLEQLADVRERLGAVIVDVRARPWSQWRPEVRKEQLTKRFGADYLHRPELGNQSSDLPGRVETGGLVWLGASYPRPRLLLCLEKAPSECHRHHAIAMQLPLDSVVHLYHDGQRWIGIEAHELQRSLDEGRQPGHLLFGRRGAQLDLRCIGWCRTPHAPVSPSEELISKLRQSYC